MGLAMANVLADGFNVLRGGNDDAGKRAELPHCALSQLPLLGNSTPTLYSRWRLHRLFGTFRASPAIELTHVPRRCNNVSCASVLAPFLSRPSRVLAPEFVKAMDC
jgi:hypothetical protein